MLVEKLKQIAKDLGWSFNNGASHWQNLNDLPDDTDMPFEDKQVYLLLLWNDQILTVNEYNVIDKETYEGEFILCVRSNVHDENYNFKYDQHISKLRIENKKAFEKFSICDEWRITRWRNSEVENMYDTNIDGIKIIFTIDYGG